ncbi:2'-5' RNA ligase family protein [Oceanirhabdus sp. W0125-5]|uniref:2'-5' RNA ligase family protein n=1 Tax=Oceanirhabdus sp. W0125-5 TaxID=2999116 RepID=UPI0022F2B3ED|nr:2'-5' RNA ligase family protein [Oceanirhabdus sp. W0125-5]WBW96320.1 2'-5' RNA ligase family protein [Oceanirhabdus sp. W0125-5]
MNCDMKRRTIMIFPQFENIKIIDEIREKYDPLAHHVRPHITLVFTFESNLTSIELKEHLEKSLAGTSPFRLTMGDIIKIDNPLGMYLFLVLKEGIEDIKKLSSKLYAGILEPYKPEWLNEKTFLPHMTIGSFTSRDDLDMAFKDVSVIKENFTTIVNKVSVEIIDENEDSIIDIEVNLSND